MRSPNSVSDTNRRLQGEGVRRVRMLVSAAGAESSRAAVVASELPNLGRLQQTSAAVVTTTCIDLLECRLTAVAPTTSYCWRLVGWWLRWRVQQWKFAEIGPGWAVLEQLLRLSIPPPRQQTKEFKHASHHLLGVLY